jgi:hypothetical protein
MFVFLVFSENCAVKSCSLIDDQSAYDVSWFYFDWCKFRVHLRSFNVCHFGMVEATGLNITASRSPSIA